MTDKDRFSQNRTPMTPAIVASEETYNRLRGFMQAPVVQIAALQAWVTAISTDQVPEGTTNLYYSNARAVAAATAAGFITSASLPTKTSQLTNDSGFITTSTLGSYVTTIALAAALSPYATTTALTTGLAGKEPTIAAGTTTQYWRGDKTWVNFPTIPAAQIQSDWNQATTSALDFIKNKPVIPSVARTSSAFSLAITGTGATGTQVSSTKDAKVGVTYSTQTTSTLIGANTSQVIVKVCATNSATEANWVEYGRTGNDQPTGIAVVIGQVIKGYGQIVVPVPLGWFVKAVSSGSGTHTEAFVSGWQELYG